MIMAWTILLAMVAGTGGQASDPAPDRPRPAAEASSQAHRPAPGRSLCVARRAWHRAGLGPCSPIGIEEFDPEEFDESWSFHVDACCMPVGPWMSPAWSGAALPGLAFEEIALARSARFPLRC